MHFSLNSYIYVYIPSHLQPQLKSVIYFELLLQSREKFPLISYALVVTYSYLSNFYIMRFFASVITYIRTRIN